MMEMDPSGGQQSQQTVNVPLQKLIQMVAQFHGQQQPQGGGPRGSSPQQGLAPIPSFGQQASSPSPSGGAGPGGAGSAPPPPSGQQAFGAPQLPQQQQGGLEQAPFGGSGHP